jgi:acetolactate decarboxylase
MKVLLDKVKILIILFIFISFTFGCTKDDNPVNGDDDSPVLVQVSVIDALLQGIFEGIIPISNLKDYGDIGIGTFDKLDGEMIMYNDTIYQVVYSGEVKVPSEDIKTPFASVCEWKTNSSFSLERFNFDSLQTNFDDYFPTANIFYGVKMKGKFKYMKTRIVEPNKPLGEAAANQHEFEFNNIDGVIVGFYCPEYVKGINATGFHLHFLSGDRKSGGHILSFEIEKVDVELCFLYDFKLILPEEGSFFTGDFTVDRQEELEEAEGDN